MSGKTLWSSRVNLWLEVIPNVHKVLLDICMMVYKKTKLPFAKQALDWIGQLDIPHHLLN